MSRIEEQLRTFQLSGEFPRRMIFERCILPVEESERQITIAASRPHDPMVSAILTYLLQKEVCWLALDENLVRKLIQKHYGVGGDTLHALMDKDGDGSVAGAQDLDASCDDEEASVVRFVNQVIREARRERATDIHFEPMEDSLRIRFRVDGVLRPVPLPPDIKRFENSIISRVKVMSGMDIAERRLPQDGRLQTRMDGEELDVRVSTIPTAHGESVSLRLLARRSAVMSLEHVGFSIENCTRLRGLIRRPHGIILLTGPTGCGKSTTLYTALSEINREELRIITIEDPIEYTLAGVNQVQVRTDIQFDFARCLRHVLRQDPDVIMVGEIRDHETAEIAIRASLTGHLVFSTLHTNDAPGAVTRLLDMGVEPFLVSSSLQLVIAQRLVRTVCPHCAKPCGTPSALPPADFEWLCGRSGDFRFRQGAGCERCGSQGYLGRTAIHEFMELSETLRPLVLNHASAATLRDASVKEGMLTLRQDGWIKAAQGITTVDEVMRVTEERE